jgi:UDP-N-acetylglucosamine 2-epimerase (non-hydrolysing)
MSDVFFEDLGMPAPDVFLNVGSETHARQTARVMTGFEDVIRANRPDIVVVAGDVNSTVAAALVASKECIPLAHIEAGLRSFDRSMPEEINRIVTDHLSDFLFTTEESANLNLLAEGFRAEGIHFVGNCMVDSLQKHLNRALDGRPWDRFGQKCNEYVLVTLHRPSNVDDLDKLGSMIKTLNEVSQLVPILFPLHPRTRGRLSADRFACSPRIVFCEPLPYIEFLGLMAKARFVMTDSGGIQEETTALRIPCLTLRDNTERPVTVKCGSNRLVGTNHSTILETVHQILSRPPQSASLPPMWDGQAARRVGDILEKWLERKEGGSELEIE